MRSVTGLLAGMAVVVCASCGSNTGETSATTPSTTAPSTTRPIGSVSTTENPTTTSDVQPASSASSVAEATTTPDTLAANTTSGVLIEWQPWDEFHTRNRSVAGELELDACRWRAPGTFDFDVRWVPDDDSSSATMLDIGLELRTGDVGTGWGGVATVSGPGSFSIPLMLDGVGEEDIEAQAGRSETTVEWASQCSVLLNVPADFAGSTELAVTVDPAPSTAVGTQGDPVTVSDLAATIDIADIDDPLLPLPRLLRSEQLPTFDTLYLLPDRQLDYIEVDETGGCVQVRSLYGWIDDAAPFVELFQRGGCPGEVDTSGSSLIDVDDDIWTLSAFADDPASLALELKAFPFVASEEAVDSVASGFDADRFLDATIADSGVAELARFDWLDGRVAAVQVGTNNWGGEYEGLSATTELFNPGSTSVMCRQRGTFLASDNTARRYALVFVRGDRTAQVDLGDGVVEAIELVPTTLPEWSAGLVDLTGTNVTDLESIGVLEPDGSETPCVQN